MTSDEFKDITIEKNKEKEPLEQKVSTVCYRFEEL